MATKTANTRQGSSPVDKQADRTAKLTWQEGVTGNRKLGDTARIWCKGSSAVAGSIEIAREEQRTFVVVCCPQRGPSETFLRSIIHMLCLNRICETLTAFQVYAARRTRSALTHVLPLLKYWPDVPSNMFWLWSPFILCYYGSTFEFTNVTCLLLRDFQNMFHDLQESSLCTHMNYRVIVAKVMRKLCEVAGECGTACWRRLRGEPYKCNKWRSVVAKDSCYLHPSEAIIHIYIYTHIYIHTYNNIDHLAASGRILCPRSCD